MSKKLHARVIWRDNMIFEGDMEGHTLMFDGYGKAGPSPVEVLLASVGACTAKLIKQTLHAMHQEYSGWK